MSIEQPAKKRRLSLQLRKHEPLKTVQLNISRFRPPVNDKEYVTAAKGVIPVNTKSATNWALGVFKVGMKERHEVMASPDEIPKNILDCRDPCVLSKFLRYFVLEVRKEDGSAYPPASIRSILSGINRVLKDNGAPFSIMNKEDPLFRELFLTLDSVTSGLHREGVGATKKQCFCHHI